MATSWDEPKCSACRADFRRIRSGPDRGLGIYTECDRCERERLAQEAAEKAARRRRLIASESEEHWRRLRRIERGPELSEQLGDEGPMPNPRPTRRKIEKSPMDGKFVHITVVRAHDPPGQAWWKVSEHYRPPVFERGEIIGTWTDPDYRGFGPDWFWVARRLSNGDIHYIHPMSISWDREAKVPNRPRRTPR